MRIGLRSLGLSTRSVGWLLAACLSLVPAVAQAAAPPPNDPSRDILFTIQEAPAGSLLFGVGVNTDSGFSGSIIINERTFDIQRQPLSFEELFSGSAFRGAGQELRFEFVTPSSKR
jgi:outer membrane protein insertion porin family